MAMRQRRLLQKCKKINEELPTFDFEPILATHEGEHPAHGPQEILYTGDERPFQFTLAMLMAKFQEIESILVQHSKSCLGAECWSKELIEVGLLGVSRNSDFLSCE